MDKWFCYVILFLLFIRWYWIGCRLVKNFFLSRKMIRRFLRVFRSFHRFRVKNDYMSQSWLRLPQVFRNDYDEYEPNFWINFIRLSYLEIATPTGPRGKSRIWVSSIDPFSRKFWDPLSFWGKFWDPLFFPIYIWHPLFHLKISVAPFWLALRRWDLVIFMREFPDVGFQN